MDKKKIVSTTIMFVIIVSTIVGFKTVFGSENTLVAVSGITAALSLLGTDYTINPLKNTVYFVFLELILGISTYLASTSAILGLVLTFAIVFYILYSFTYNTKKPTYVAFALGYFFMLYSPVTLEALPKRLMGLIICGLVIMAMQMIVNKNKFKKEAKEGIKKSIEHIKNEIDLVLNSSEFETIDNTHDITYNNLRALMEPIYRRIDNNVELPVLIMHYLAISEYLENVNLTLSKIRKSKNSNECEKVLIEIKKTLSKINSFVDDTITDGKLYEELKCSKSIIEEFKSNHYLICELYDLLSIVVDSLKLKEEEYKESIKGHYISSEIVYNLTELKNNINKNSIKFTFAFRGALLMSIAVFAVSFFNIEYGKWIVFSLLAIIQPYYETSKTKTKDRFIGTIIGLLSFVVLFSIVSSEMGRMLLIMLVGYIMNYQNEYKYRMVSSTLCALGVASLGAEVSVLSLKRMLFVFIGTLIALYANKIIFPQRIKDVTKNEIDKSIKLNEKIFEKLNYIGTRKLKIDEEFKKLITTNAFLNDKIRANNSILGAKSIDEFLYSERIFMYEIRSLIGSFKDHDKNEELKLSCDVESTYSVKDDSVNDINSKLILVRSTDIKEHLKKSKEIYNLIQAI